MDTRLLYCIGTRLSEIHFLTMTLRHDPLHETTVKVVDLLRNYLGGPYTTPPSTMLEGRYSTLGTTRNRVGLGSNVISMLQDAVLQLPASYVMVGDLNAHHHHLSWESYKVDEGGERLRQLLDMLGYSVLDYGPVSGR